MINLKKLRGRYWLSQTLSGILVTKDLLGINHGEMFKEARVVEEFLAKVDGKETQGVCVAAYQTNEFPAFFTEASGCKAPCRVDTPEDYARLIGKQY
nr:pseudouridine-metabolizing bifunctional protein C1861.05 [Ipomoea batatas]